MLDNGHPLGGINGRGAARRRLLDRLLLDVAMHQPDQIEPAFAALFARNPLPAVLAFLDGQTTARQDAALVRTLPPAAFVGDATRCLSARTGARPSE